MIWRPQVIRLGRERARALLLVALAFILAVTLVPRSGANEQQWRPFVEIGPALEHPLGASFVVNVVGNLLLFLPFGAALALLGRGPLVTAALGCLTSTSIELAQLLVPGRTSATDDIILNTVGALLGYAASRSDVTRRRTVGR